MIHNFFKSNHFNTLINKIFLPIVLLSFSLTTFVAFEPQLPGTSLDAAWQYGMNYGVNQGFVFGKDIIFTFGPYAGIITNSYYPGLEKLILGSGIFLSICFFFLIMYFIKEKPIPIKLLIIPALAILLSSQNDGPFYIFLLIISLHLLKLSSQNSFNTKNNLLIVPLTFPVGLIVLIKGSFLLFAGVAVGLPFIYNLWRKNWQSAALIIFIPLISTITFWITAGQPLNALPGFFLSLKPIISGYSEAMGGATNYYKMFAYLLISIVTLLWLFFEKRAEIIYKIFLFILIAAMLFICLKAGFVGGGIHIFYSNLPLVFTAFLLFSDYPGKLPGMILVASLGLWLFTNVDGNYQSSLRQINKIMNPAKYPTRYIELYERIKNPEILKNAYSIHIDSLQDIKKLPKLNGTCDIMPHHQSYLIASGNNYTPRPVFQSYCAYSPELAEKNVRFFKGDKRPEHLFFAINPIRKRFPSLEDGSTWPVLLSNYQPSGIYSEFLHLEKKKHSELNSSELKKIFEGNALLGETVNIPQISGKLVFAKVNIEKNFLGRILNFLFKTTKLEIDVKLHTEEQKSYKFIPAMGKSLFMISPLIESGFEFGTLYGNSLLLESKNLKTFTIRSGHSIQAWKRNYTVEFYTLDLPAASESFNLVDKFEPIENLGDFNVTTDCPCKGNLEIPKKSVSKAGKYMLNDPFFNYIGWLAKAPKEGIITENAIVLLTNLKDETYYMKGHKISRENVGKYFKQPKMANSGFITRGDVSSFEGNWTVKLAYLEDGVLCVCPSTTKEVIFGAVSNQ
jgi:hypothetical protein